MTWFKENKFLAGLISITILIAALLIFLIMKSGSALADKQAEIDAKKAALSKMKSLDPFPEVKHARAKDENMKAMIKKANEAREKILAFSPGELTNIDPNEFSANLTKGIKKVKALFPEEKALPSSFDLGFGEYTGGVPKRETTGVLSYQLGAMEYVFEELKKAGINEVQNLYRAELPVEKGQEWPDASGPGANKAKGGGKSRGRNRSPRKGTNRPRKSATTESLPYVAHSMPFELVIKGKEGAARKFISNIASSDQYFIKTVLPRTVNMSPIPKSGKMASKSSGGGDWGSVPLEGEDGAPVEAVQILDKISGGDDLVTFLRMEILLFSENQTFPELK